jgi:hypothetical protein
MPLHLYVEPMDAVLVDADAEGRIRFEDENGSTPTLQERRAILYSAGQARDELTELIQTLDQAPG